MNLTPKGTVNNMALNETMIQYAASVQEELKQLIRDLCAIPAPSHHEEKRAEFCKNWFLANGGRDVYIDEALNAVCSWGVTENNEVVVVMAHTDTVFPDLEPLPFEEDGKQFRCPGVADDTAELAILMLCARYCMQNCPVPQVGVLFVANSGEEGLGNLKGSKAIVERYGSRMRELITLDGTQMHAIVSQAVGSHRYRVTVKTEGGHSFNAFGNRNAIRCLASMIDTLYSVKVPQEGNSKTTYNVGTISGGTSVNTIAQEAEMLYEYRSDNKNCLAQMEAMFHQVVAAYNAMGITVEAEKIGDRPCTGDVDPEKHRQLIDRAAGAICRNTGGEVVLRSGSTDCNPPLAAGIPAICISPCTGGGCHTREEYLELDSLETGCRLVLDLLAETIG